MSSHREAPEIAKDPVADNTDVYAFVSPDRPGTVTIITNFIPLQLPYGGPNFYEFGDDVVYDINVSNKSEARADLVYRFRFSTKLRNGNTFLYNTGPIKGLDDPNWNRPQTYSVTLHTRGREPRVLGQNLRVPPVNIGPRSTPDYARLAGSAVHDLGGGRKVFAGQRAEGFFVDLGSIFDLGTLRPFEHLHLIPSADAMGVNGGQGVNVHSIALQVPITDLTEHGRTPKGVDDKHAVIGVWSSTSRQKSRILSADDPPDESGPWVQVSRLGNPLFNEVIVPLARKDEWNREQPRNDVEYEPFVLHPELAKLLPVLYPAVFPKLAAYTKPRADLAAILLTGIPKGVIPGFQNFTGRHPADLLRLNVAIPPSSSPNRNGILGGDLAGFPNGRRVFDDIIAIELRAVAGATIPLVDPGFTPDAAASLLKDGTSNTNSAYLPSFPYLGVPAGGYQTTPPVPAI